MNAQTELAPETSALQRLVGATERALFHNRLPVLVFFFAASLLLGWKALELRPDASFTRSRRRRFLPSPLPSLSSAQRRI